MTQFLLFLGKQMSCNKKLENTTNPRESMTQGQRLFLGHSQQQCIHTFYDAGLCCADTQQSQRPCWDQVLLFVSSDLSRFISRSVFNTVPVVCECFAADFQVLGLINQHISWLTVQPYVYSIYACKKKDAHCSVLLLCVSFRTKGHCLCHY